VARLILEEETTMTQQAINWSAIEADPRFKELHARKTAFLWGLMAFSVVYYFALPLGAVYLTDVFRIKVWGPVNVGLLFALSEFVVAWGIAFIYSRRAVQFDAMAEAINRDSANIGA
jgi:uncharacterized membrane protein (DUF485 family)